MISETGTALSATELSRTKSRGSAAGVAAQAPRIFSAGLLQALGGRRADGLNFLGPEAEQGCNVADLVELGIVFHIERLDIAPHHPRQNRLADIDNFLRGSATCGTEADEMGINVPAARAFDGVCLQVLADQQRLDLS